MFDQPDGKEGSKIDLDFTPEYDTRNDGGSRLFRQTESPPCTRVNEDERLKCCG